MTTRYQISRTPACGPGASQQGVALVFGLIMLLVMTLLALSGMNMSNLQFLMAGNTQQQTQALVLGENALSFGQNDIANNIIVKNINAPAVTTPTVTGNGYYIYAETGTNVAVSGDSVWTSGNYRSATGEPDERYIIEYIDNRDPPGATLTGDPNKSRTFATRNLFRLSARGLSDKGARRTLQTIVVTEQAVPL